MKKFYLFVLLVVLFNSSFAAPVIKSVTNGDWNQSSTWNLNRLPQVGDTIVISTGNMITVNSSINLNGASFLKTYGEITFQNNTSTLSLGTGSYIWVFSGALIMGGGSASQKLRLGGSIIFMGNEDPVYGPVMASSVSNGFAAMVNNNPIVLPVKFVGFTVTHRDNDVLVQWSTSQEINSDLYQVERSLDGTNWNTIAYVTAEGNTSDINNYSLTDKNVSAKIAYYRVKEVDLGGKTTYTSIKTIKAETVSNSEISIASVQNKVLLQFSQEVIGNLTVRFVSLSGQVVDQQNINNPVGQVVLNSRVTGNYIISISNGQNINTAKQVIL